MEISVVHASCVSQWRAHRIATVSTATTLHVEPVEHAKLVFLISFARIAAEFHVEHACPVMHAHGVITESGALELLAEPVLRATLAQQACFGCSAVVGTKACARPAAVPTDIFDTTAAGWLVARVWPVNHVRRANIAAPAAA